MPCKCGKMWHGLTWVGMGWHGLAWAGMGWHGLAWAGTGGHGLAWANTLKCPCQIMILKIAKFLKYRVNFECNSSEIVSKMCQNMAWAGMGWHGPAWAGMGRHGLAWAGMGWHGLAWAFWCLP